MDASYVCGFDYFKFALQACSHITKTRAIIGSQTVPPKTATMNII